MYISTVTIIWPIWNHIMGQRFLCMSNKVYHYLAFYGCCRCPDLAVRTQLVMMLRVPRPRWLMQETTQSCTDLSWFRPRGRTFSKGVCESTILSCTGGACSRGYKRGERRREAPRSLLEEELIETSANIGA